MSTAVIDAGADAAPRNAPSVVHRLRRELEDYARRRARGAGWARGFVPTGLAPLDAVLPRGGLPRGAITEVLSDGPGVGVMTLAMRIAAGVARTDCPFIVVVDAERDFYPPAAGPFGISLDQLLVVRPRKTGEVFWATEQALRCPAVGTVITSLEATDAGLSRRLQLAAESTGCMGLILRSSRRRGRTFAAVQLLVESIAWARGGEWRMASGEWQVMNDEARRLGRITVLKVREGTPAGPLLVDLHHETGVGVVPSLPADRSVAGLA